MNQMHALQRQSWNLLNTASILLLPKNHETTDAKDYRPDSLMHSAAKILCKLLANRLAPELHKLVIPECFGQGAFHSRQFHLCKECDQASTQEKVASHFSKNWILLKCSIPRTRASS
jgi:hypothetical protein